MIILSIDLGSHTGIVVYDIEQKSILHNETKHFKEKDLIKRIVSIYKYFKDLIYLWKPAIIITPTPVRFYNTYKTHFQYQGVVSLLCGLNNIKSHITNDKHCKSIILKQGNSNKIAIEEYYKNKGIELNTEHEYDALMFAEAYILDYLK